jgi:hypothetical protein
MVQVLSVRGKRSVTMEVNVDADRFARWTRTLTDREPLSRRGLSGLAAGTVAALTLTRDGAAKKKKKCPAKPGRVVCPAGADYCTDETTWYCGRDCACATGTSATICAPLNVEVCLGCLTDAECVSQTGPGSVCAVTGTTFCSCGGESRICLPPCAQPIPVACS